MIILSTTYYHHLPQRLENNNETTEMNEIKQKLDGHNIRDEKIWNLTLIGWSKTRIAKELKLSRTTVSMVVSSEHGQKRLSEMYETVEQPLMMLPELVGIATNQLKNVLEGKYHHEKAKTIIDAARLVFGVAVKFKELDSNMRHVTQIN
jgi:predicted transcriptional regulator